MNDELSGADAPGRAKDRSATAKSAASVTSRRYRAVEFEDFYRAESANLVWFVMRASGANVYEAWDAAQTALIEAWLKWDRIDNPAGFVRKVAVRAFLRGTPNRKFASDAPVPDSADAMLTPELVAELTESTARARSLLRDIPITQRLHFALHLDGFSTEEIAELTGKSSDAVRKNVYRAKTTLKKKITTRGGA